MVRVKVNVTVHEASGTRFIEVVKDDLDSLGVLPVMGLAIELAINVEIDVKVIVDGVHVAHALQFDILVLGQVTNATSQSVRTINPLHSIANGYETIYNREKMKDERLGE